MVKNSTLHSASTRPEATLDISYTGSDAYQDEVYQWQLDGAIYAEMLSRHDCPQAFREAFTAIFTEHLFEECQAAHPRMIEVAYPLVVLSLQSEIPADANRVVDVLLTLRETLAGDFAKKVMGEMKLKGGAS